MNIKVVTATIVWLLFGGLFPAGDRANFSAQMGGMHEMKNMHPAGVETINVLIKTKPEKITAGKPSTVTISIRDQKGKPVEELTVHHDRLLHVIIASQDFSVFSHIHPEDFGPITSRIKKTARYPVRFTFPKAGRYIIGIDFAIKEKLFSRSFVVNVTGGPEMGPPKEDLSGEKSFDGLNVAFATVPEQISSGKEVSLNYTFRKSGEPVNDLEPYLSAPMHLAIISADLAHFIHTHGELPGMPAMEHGGHHMDMIVPEKFGPDINVHVVFPAKGLFQIFGQVGYKGRIITTSFMVKVD